MSHAEHVDWHDGCCFETAAIVSDDDEVVKRRLIRRERVTMAMKIPVEGLIVDGWGLRSEALGSTNK